jgi:hypothetical protein
MAPTVANAPSNPLDVPAEAQPFGRRLQEIVLALMSRQESLLDVKGELQCLSVNTDLPTFPIPI